MNKKEKQAMADLVKKANETQRHADTMEILADALWEMIEERVRSMVEEVADEKISDLQITT